MKIAPITQAANIYNNTRNSQKQNEKRKQKGKEITEKFSIIPQKDESNPSK